MIHYPPYVNYIELITRISCTTPLIRFFFCCRCSRIKETILVISICEQFKELLYCPKQIFEVKKKCCSSCPLGIQVLSRTNCYNYTIIFNYFHSIGIFIFYILYLLLSYTNYTLLGVVTLHGVSRHECCGTQAKKNFILTLYFISCCQTVIFTIICIL